MEFIKAEEAFLYCFFFYIKKKQWIFRYIHNVGRSATFLSFIIRDKKTSAFLPPDREDGDGGAAVEKYEKE